LLVRVVRKTVCHCESPEILTDLTKWTKFLRSKVASIVRELESLSLFTTMMDGVLKGSLLRLDYLVKETLNLKPQSRDIISNNGALTPETLV